MGRRIGWCEDCMIFEPDRDSPIVIYIMGTGRSGSTLLGTALSNLPGVFFAGELDAYARRRGEPNGDTPALREFWAAVARSVEMPPSAERFHGRVEHLSALFRPASRAMVKEFDGFTARLYRAVGAKAGANVVVDSSHYPIRRWHLRRCSVDMVTIHLVRDPRSVVQSMRGPGQGHKGWFAVNVYVALTNVLSSIVFVAVCHPSRRIRVRYEDFAIDPANEVARIARVVGIDYEPVDFSHLHASLPFQGNRMRLEDGIAVHPPSRVRSSLPTTITHLPWLIAFGYVRSQRRLRAKRQAVVSAGSESSSASSC